VRLAELDWHAVRPYEPPEDERYAAAAYLKSGNTEVAVFRYALPGYGFSLSIRKPDGELSWCGIKAEQVEHLIDKHTRASHEAA
jgi:hypothetical protein